MKKYDLSKYVAIITILIVLIVVFFIVYMINNTKDQDLSEDYNLVSNQKNRIISFYNKNKEELNNIKDALWKDEYSIREIRDDGYIKLSDNSTIWLDDVSLVIKQIYSFGKEYGVRSIDYGTLIDKEFRVEAFFYENDVEIDLVYSEVDLSINDYMYSNIEDNWYLFVAGMT